MDELPLRQARDELPALVSRARDLNEPVAITVDGEQAAVVVSAYQYASLVETLAVLGDDRLMEELAVAKRLPGSVGLDEIRTRLGQIRGPAAHTASELPRRVPLPKAPGPRDIKLEYHAPGASVSTWSDLATPPAWQEHSASSPPPWTTARLFQAEDADPEHLAKLTLELVERSLATLRLLEETPSKGQVYLVARLTALLRETKVARNTKDFRPVSEYWTQANELSALVARLVNRRDPDGDIEVVSEPTRRHVADYAMPDSPSSAG